MDYYYSPATRGFYVDGISLTKPEDCVQITEELYHALLLGQENGLIITPPDLSNPLPHLRPPVLSDEQALAAFTAAIQHHLDSFAQNRNYDGILSAASYATSKNPRFSAEGQYAVEARDATWATAYAIMDDVLAGRRPMPTIEEVVAELPLLAWPEVAA